MAAPSFYSLAEIAAAAGASRLRILDLPPEWLKASEIAEHLGLSRENVRGHLQALHKAGLVEKIGPKPGARADLWSVPARSRELSQRLRLITESGVEMVSAPRARVLLLIDERPQDAHALYQDLRKTLGSAADELQAFRVSRLSATGD